MKVRCHRRTEYKTTIPNPERQGHGMPAMRWDLEFTPSGEVEQLILHMRRLTAEQAMSFELGRQYELELKPL